MTQRTARWGSRVARVAPPLLVGALPAVLLSLGVARFILNHFFADAPYLLDSGLLSSIAYRAGLLLAPPPIAAGNLGSFYQIYFAPIVSVFSALSYLLPVHRIEWFAFVEAMVFFPIGIAGYALASRIEPAGLLRRLPITMIATFAFAFSGLVVWMVGYPHFEAAIAGLTCLVLVAVVTGRTRLTWVFLGLAASVRQDGGVHVALALAPLLYLEWRGTDMLPSRRRLLATIGVAIGTSVVAIACQKVFFVPVDRLREVYLGTPAYAHLSVVVLLDRARSFVAVDQVIYYPFLATLLIAVLRRDAGYVLGWAAAVPWFLFNFMALDGAKSSFVAYTAAPFLVSVFWVYLYGGLLAPVKRRLRRGMLEAAFALVCVSSMLGHYRAAPAAFTMTVREMSVSQPRSRSAVHGFVDALHTHRADFGRLYVDYGVAALALEWLGFDESWPPYVTPTPDTIAFHDRAAGGSRIVLSDLVAHRLDACTHALRTHLFACSREPLPATTFTGIATETIPSVFAFTQLHRPGVQIEQHGLTLLDGYTLDGSLGPLARGTYEWTMALATDAPAPVGCAELVRLSIETDRPRVDGPVRAIINVPTGSHEVALRFEADGEESFGYRLTSFAPLPLHIMRARLRRIEAN